MIGLGFVFSELASFYLTEIIAIIMVAAGLFVGLKSVIFPEKKNLVNESKPLSEIGSKNDSGSGKSLRTSVSYFAILGAALSPDLSILPIFLIAVPVGLSLAIDTAVVFAVASILTIIFLALVGSMGLTKAFENLPPKYNDAIAGFVIAAVGIYILIVGRG